MPGDLCFEIQLILGFVDLVLERVAARQQGRLGALYASIGFRSRRFGVVVGGHASALSNSHALGELKQRAVVGGGVHGWGTRLASGADMNTSKNDHHDEQPAELIAGVLNDARDLAVAEVDKLKAETITKVKDAGEEVKIASIGLMILTVAAIMTGMALSFGISALGVPIWAGFAIVAVVFGIWGTVFLKKRRAIAEAT
ncbi:MAG: phage holin family protein [Myxococcales bacterium]|nr:phage holin family protein [Myxococcales bacterium]